VHSGVIPLSGVGGHDTEVTPRPLDPLTAVHVQPLRLAITEDHRLYFSLCNMSQSNMSYWQIYRTVSEN